MWVAECWWPILISDLIWFCLLLCLSLSLALSLCVFDVQIASLACTADTKPTLRTVPSVNGGLFMTGLALLIEEIWSQCQQCLCVCLWLPRHSIYFWCFCLFYCSYMGPLLFCKQYPFRRPCDFFPHSDLISIYSRYLWVMFSHQLK